MAIAGIPWWTTDIGGFDYGDPADENYQELYMRWFEYATFCPVLRLHGYRAPYRPADPEAKGAGQCYSGGDNEIWSHGERAFHVSRDHIMLRERLKPYLTAVMNKAHEKGTPPMRPLFYDFPSDKRCWDVEDEYMFGDDLLICPITELGKRQREVYFPEGEIWVDPYTFKEYTGGVTFTVDAPLERIPVFVRQASGFDIKVFKKC